MKASPGHAAAWPGYSEVTYTTRLLVGRVFLWRDQPYQRPRCTTSSKGRRSGDAIGASGRPAG